MGMGQTEAQSVDFRGEEGVGRSGLMAAIHAVSIIDDFKVGEVIVEHGEDDLDGGGRSRGVDGVVDNWSEDALNRRGGQSIIGIDVLE